MFKVAITILFGITSMLNINSNIYTFSYINIFVTCPSDSDNDGVCDNQDVCPGFDDNIDSDNDTTPNGCDICPFDALNDIDGDGFCFSVDNCIGYDDNLDADNDGIPDGCDSCPNDYLNLDSDNDGVCDNADICPGFDDGIDSDNDGTPNGCDICPLDALNDSDGDGICDNLDICQGFDDLIDSDNDNIPDGCDACPLDALNDSDNDGVCDSQDSCLGFDDAVDSDNDGTPDGCDLCPTDILNLDSDLDGVCDSVDICNGFDDAIDSDNDLIPDGCDVCPQDPLNDSDNDGICDSQDICLGFDDALDLDNDGIADGCDDCLNDPLNDSNNDGYCDQTNLCILTNDSDGDGICDQNDICQGYDDSIDSDNDGIPNGCDACPNDSSNDLDNDGYCDQSNFCVSYNDADNDGVCDVNDICPGFNDNLDFDNDGFPNGCDVCPNDFLNDFNNDGICDFSGLCIGINDVDQDGICDSIDVCLGANDNLDYDNDQIPNACDICPNNKFNDANNDGICDTVNYCLNCPSQCFNNVLDTLYEDFVDCGPQCTECFDCPYDMIHINSLTGIDTLFLKVRDYIFSDCLIKPIKRISYKAGNYVELGVGFDSNTGSSLYAGIEKCNEQTMLTVFEMGQSNMASKFGLDLNIIPSDKNVKYFNPKINTTLNPVFSNLVHGHNSGISQDINYVYSAGTIYANLLQELNKDEQVFLLKLGKSNSSLAPVSFTINVNNGQPIEDWNPISSGELFDQFSNAWREVSDKAIELNKKVEIDKIIWNQWESDLTKSQSVYYQLLKSHILAVNEELGTFPMWVIVLASNDYLNIRNAQIQICNDFNKIKCQETDYVFKPDGFHFSNQDLIILAQDLLNNF